MGRVTLYRCDPELVEILVTRSMPTLEWMRSKSVRFVPIYGRQAFKVDGKFKFWGGLTVEAWGGGPGLVDAMSKTARQQDIQIWYGARAMSLVANDGAVRGVKVRRGDKAECANYLGCSVDWSNGSRCRGDGPRPRHKRDPSPSSPNRRCAPVKYSACAAIR